MDFPVQDHTTVEEHSLSFLKDYPIFSGNYGKCFQQSSLTIWRNLIFKISLCKQKEATLTRKCTRGTNVDERIKKKKGDIFCVNIEKQGR